MKKIILVGATSAIAQHCARLWVQQAAQSPIELVLLGRDVQKLERMAADLRARGPECRVRAIQAGFIAPQEIETAVDDSIQDGPADVVLIAHGALPDQAHCQRDLHACRDALEINGVSPALYAQAYAEHMARIGRGTLAIIGSVAGDRGRQSNMLYGAAKSLLARLAQGLQHRFHGTPIKVVLIKPGPTNTPMTAHLQNQGARLASVETVARHIVHAIATGRATVYTPGIWRWVMLALVHMPRFVFNKIRI